MKIGFIGCGNMGGALAKAVSRCEGTEILLCDRNGDKLSALANATSGRKADDKTIARECDYLFIGVKPYGVSPLLSSLSDELKLNTGGCVVCMAAGVKIEQITEAIGFPYPIIRIMPNTPVAYGEGMTLASANAEVSDKAWEAFTEIMARTGRLDRIEEKYIDAASAVSGSGPAFVYMFLEALAQGGVKAGLPYDKALSYAEQTLIGASVVAREDGRDTESLRIAVCSPGGSTIEGVGKLNEGGFGKCVEGAVMATFEKAKKLGNTK